MSKQLTEADVLALAAAVAGSGGGTGDGDMKKSVYDNDSAVSDAGGIKAFVQANAGDDNVQSDWEQDDDTKDDFIKNKPNIPEVEALTNVQVNTLKGLI